MLSVILIRDSLNCISIVLMPSITVLSFLVLSVWEHKFFEVRFGDTVRFSDAYGFYIAFLEKAVHCTAPDVQDCLYVFWKENISVVL